MEAMPVDEDLTATGPAPITEDLVPRLFRKCPVSTLPVMAEELSCLETQDDVLSECRNVLEPARIPAVDLMGDCLTIRAHAMCL